MYGPGIPKSTKASVFSKQRQQDIVDGVNAAQSITGGGDLDIRNGPTGRSLFTRANKVLHLPVVVKISGNTVPPVTGSGSITLQTGWYSARLQHPRTNAYKPLNAFAFNDYYQDASGTDDIYVVNYDDADGTNHLSANDYAEGHFSWSLKDPTIPYRAVVVIPAAGGGGGVIPVQLVPTFGVGSQGDNSTIRSYTYTVLTNDSAMTVIASNVPWIMRPQDFGKYNPANYGLMFTDSNGNTALAWTNEAPATGPC